MSTIIFLVGYGVPYFETYLLFTYVMMMPLLYLFSYFIYVKLKTENKGQSASLLITLHDYISTHSRSLFRQHFGVEVNIKIATSPCKGGGRVVGGGSVPGRAPGLYQGVHYPQLHHQSRHQPGIMRTLCSHYSKLIIT